MTLSFYHSTPLSVLSRPRLGHEPRLDQAPNRAEKRQADAVGQILRVMSHLRQERADDRHRHEKEEVAEQELVKQGLVGHLSREVWH